MTTLVRAALSMSSLTLLSRVLGFVRDAATYHLLGVGWVSGSFVLAWMVPNLLRRLFGEGALAAAFVPAFAKLHDRDPRAARHLLGGVSGTLIGLMTLLVAGVILASFVVPPSAIGLAGEGVTAAERGSAILELVRILFPYALPVCLLALYAGALQSLGVFAVPAAAPALLNICWIGGLVTGASLYPDDVLAIAQTTAIALLIGGFAQLTLGVVPLVRRGMFALPRIPHPNDGSREVFYAMVPAALGLSLMQCNLLVDQALAEFLIGDGANNHIYLANRLLLFPHALVAIPLATAVLPILARASSIAELRTNLSRTSNYTLVLSIPAAVGMVLVADALIDVLFVHGRYAADDARNTWSATLPLIAGLPALGQAQLLARAFFALGDTRTPARVAGALVFVNLALNLTFVLGLGMGVSGFTFATTCCAFLNVWLLERILWQKGVFEPRHLPRILRLVAAVGVMAATVLLSNWFLPEGESRTTRVLFGVAIPIAIGIAAYASACSWLGVASLSELVRGLRRKSDHSRRTNSK